MQHNIASSFLIIQEVGRKITEEGELTAQLKSKATFASVFPKLDNCKKQVKPHHISDAQPTPFKDVVFLGVIGIVRSNKSR